MTENLHGIYKKPKEIFQEKKKTDVKYFEHLNVKVKNSYIFCNKRRLEYDFFDHSLNILKDVASTERVSIKHFLNEVMDRDN